MLKRLALLTILLTGLVALVPATASAASCWQELVNDYWADNRVDRTYPISCYREAMTKLPDDVQAYSDAQDDLRRALLAAIRNERDGGSSTWDPDTTAVPPTAGPDDDDGEPKGFFSQVIDELGPKNADSIPVPLLVLGAIALLLMGAAGVSYLARYLQARRLDVPEPRP